MTTTDNKMLGVVVRGDVTYVAPRSGVLAHRCAIDPVLTAPSTVEGISDAIMRAYWLAPFESDDGVNVEDGKNPMLKAAGIRSERAFDRGAKVFELVFYGNSKVKIERWKPYPGRRSGWTQDTSWQATLPGGVGADTIAKEIVDALATAQTK